MSYKLIVAFFICCMGYSQSDKRAYGLNNNGKTTKAFFFSFGQNFTTYLYRNSLDQNTAGLKSSNGLVLEVGKRFKAIEIAGLPAHLGTSISLNQYNNLGGDGQNNYTWESNFLGLNIDMQQEIGLGAFNFFYALGTGFNKIIFGTQTLNGTALDLVNNDDFKSVFLRPFVSVGPKWNGQSTDIAFLLAVAHDFALQSNNSERLNFSNIQLKIRLWIK